MARPTWLAFAVVVALSGCTRLTPEQQLIDDAARALGGQDRIRAVRTLALEGEGSNFNLGQDMRPEAASQTFSVTGYRRVLDVSSGRMKVEQTRTPNSALRAQPEDRRHRSPDTSAFRRQARTWRSAHRHGPLAVYGGGPNKTR